MKNIRSYTKYIVKLMLLFLSVNLVESSDSERQDCCTPIDQISGNDRLSIQGCTDPESLSSVSSRGIPHVASSPMIGEGIDVRLFSPVEQRESRSAATAISPAASQRRSCTPPQTPLDSELRGILDEASIDNKRIIEAISKELDALSKNEEVSVETWKAIFSNLKDVKDSPQKPDIKKRTIVAISKIIARESFVLLRKKHADHAAQIKVMFDANLKEDVIRDLLAEASATFNNCTDITPLPAWIVKQCFEKVQQECSSPVKHAGLRSEVEGLPLVRLGHIMHGHSFIGRDLNNIAHMPRLVDPKTKTESLVWKELPKMGDDGLPKVYSDDEIIHSKNIRKSVFPSGMTQREVEACIERAVKAPEIGTAKSTNCILKIFQDPATKIDIQVCFDAGGALISTAYPMRILRVNEWQARKPAVIMNNKTGEAVTLMKEEIVSYVKMSDRIIADCGDTVILDIGHINPLYACLIESKDVQAPAAVSCSPKVKKGKQQDVDDDLMKYKATQVMSKKLSEYCPIGIEVSFDDLETINSSLHAKVIKDRNSESAISSAVTQPVPTQGDKK